MENLRLEVVSLSEVPQPADTENLRPVVLVVDDEWVIADTVAIILSRNGFAALTAYDGFEALETAQEIPPDVLLTDVVMPGMTGIELALALEDVVKGCKILLFSGQAVTMDMVSEANAAGHDFKVLAKPVPPAQLIACVTECIEYKDAKDAQRAGEIRAIADRDIHEALADRIAI